MDEAADCDGDDLEEIEARLYSEIHHSKDDDGEQHGEADHVREVHNYSTWRSAFRYFKSPGIQQPGGFVPPAAEEEHIVVRNRFPPAMEEHTMVRSRFVPPTMEQQQPVFRGTFVPPAMGEHTFVRYGDHMAPPNAFYTGGSNVLFNGVHNNFVRPDERHSTGGLISDFTKCLLFPQLRSYIPNWQNSVPTVVKENGFREKRKKAKKPKNRTKRKGKKQQPSQQTSSTILISDDESEDCVIIQDNEGNGTNTAINDDEDDIIYIPPPPVEVISVDEEAPPPKNDDIEVGKVNSSPVNSLRKESPNDFLENYGSEHDFNFGLHGTEFRNQMELVSTNKVPYDCETESSSSTMEPGRNFNNTVKTIVFNEVEFPKGDIFAEKNLDTFESLITTRREADGTILSNVEEERSKGARNYDGNIESHSSSSESDYEVNDNSKMALPRLSFMAEENSETNKRKPGSDSEKVCNKKKPLPKKKKKKITICQDNERPNTTNKKKYFFHDSDLEDKNDSDSTQNVKSSSDNSKRKKKSFISDSETADGTDAAKKKKNFFDGSELDNKIDSDGKQNNKRNTSDNPKKKKKPSISNSEAVDGIDATKKKKDFFDDSESADKNDSDAKHSDKRSTSDNPKRKKKSINESKVDGIDATKKKKNFFDDSALNDTNNSDDTQNNTRSTSDSPKRKKKLSINGSEAVDETAATIDGDCTPVADPDNAKVEGSVTDGKRNSLIGPDNLKNKKSLGESPAELMDEIPTNVEITKTTTRGEVPIEQKSGCADNTKRKNNLTLNEPTVEVTDETAGNVIEDESSSNEVVIIEGIDSSFQIIDSCDSNDVDDLRDVIIVEDDLNLANCKVGKAKRSLANFDVAEIQRSQSDDPSKWEILEADRKLPRMLSGKDLGPRCKKCRHFGHYAYQCLDKPGPIPCRLCGGTNHQEPRCPEKQCRQCGQGKGTFSTSYCHVCAKYRYLICSMCRMRGHLDSTCPDLWRRYHLTTDVGPLVTPEGPILKPRDQQWCSGCARRGHLEHECNYYNREYPPTTPVVMDYRDILFDGGVSTNERDDIPSLLLLDIPKPNVTGEDRIVVSIPTSSNLKIQIGGGSPSAPIEVKKWLPTHDDLNHNYDAKHMKRVFMSHTVGAIKRLLESELAILRDKIAFCSPRFLRDKLYEMVRQKGQENLRKKRDFWYRTLNMYMFGVHQCREGKLHKKYIMRMLATPETGKMNSAKRKTLFGAYSYIFGCEKHKNFNYFLTIKRLIQKYDNAQASK